MLTVRGCFTILILAALSGGFPNHAWGNQKMIPSAYGERTKFQKDVPLQFPDLQLVYRGQRRFESSVRKNAFTYVEDFEANQGDHQVEVSYSHGFPGIIQPKEFTIKGQSFVLEMELTISIKDPKSSWLKEDELILWRKEDFDKKEKEAYSQKS